MTKKLDPLDLLRDPARKEILGGMPCRTCGTKWEEVIDNLYEEAIKTRPEFTHADLLKILKECGYSWGIAALKGHLEKHKIELLEKWNAR